MNLTPDDINPYLILLIAISVALGYLTGWLSRKAHEAALIGPLKDLLESIDPDQLPRRNLRQPRDY